MSEIKDAHDKYCLGGKLITNHYQTEYIKELESEKAELIECLKRCDKDMPRINDTISSCGFRPFTIMEKDIKETLQKHGVL